MAARADLSKAGVEGRAAGRQKHHLCSAAPVPRAARAYDGSSLQIRTPRLRQVAVAHDPDNNDMEPVPHGSQPLPEDVISSICFPKPGCACDSEN